MKFITKTLQNPYIKILLSPAATVLFGLILGMVHTNSIQWLSLICLLLIAVSASLIDHLFYLRYDKLTPRAAPQILLYLFEGILIVFSIIFMFNSHWIVTLLLLFYIIFIHIQYFPFKITGTIYHFILTVFFNGFVMNVIAYNSQTHGVTQDYLINLIPMLLIFAVLYLEVFNLKSLLMYRSEIRVMNRIPLLSLIIGIAAVILGFFLSLPSRSFYLIQILFFVVSTITILPLAARTTQERQIQNKMNYAHSVAFVFSLFYALSQLY